MVFARHTVMILFLFFKDRSSLHYFITQGMGQTLCSLPYTLYVILGGGGLGVLVGGGRGGIPRLHTCLL